MDATKAQDQEHIRHQPPLGAKYVSIERRTNTDTVFLVDEVPFRSSMPKATHWSIAWSDIMMTMFVLFLSMYVYKAADQDFLDRPALEIVGGDTTDALDSEKFSGIGMPITPIAPGMPLMTAGTVKKVESIDLRDIDVDSVFASSGEKTRVVTETEEIPVDRGFPVDADSVPQTGPPQTVSVGSGETVPTSRSSVPITPTNLGQPDKIQEIYRLSKSALQNNDLEEFASINLVPDSAMRIILTGDLLFDTGQADITEESMSKLEQLATAIQTTPYMVNVVGHTDNVPMYSDRYASNWELSVARASTVARFLIEDMGMNPTQFVVSGYASFRPLVENSTAEKRSTNRRVEIIISKRLPSPAPASEANLNRPQE